MHIQDLDIKALPPGSRATDWLDIALRPDGSSWRLPFLHAKGLSDGPMLLVIAGVHGDEYEGIEAVPAVHRAVDPADLAGTLALVPICNPPAFEACDRSSPVDGMNLARVFPGSSQGSISERIAHWTPSR